MLLNGASGVRLINRFRWENEEAEIDSVDQVQTYLAGCQNENTEREIPSSLADLEPNTDVAIECRNTFNFYHFITESLSQLTVLDGHNFTGDVYFHFPNQEDKQRPFARAFVDALFPELAGRVFFERAPKEYDSVISTYDFLGGHYQAPRESVSGIGDFAPKPFVEGGGLTDVRGQAVLAMNCVSSPLIALRNRGLAAIEGQDFSYLPKRFFVGRDDRQSRARHMEGEDLLFDHLRLFDFEYVVFENLSPLEQVAIMAQAEVMISYHGAGFTNMLFANPDTYVIELGTLQTAQFRWGDFWPLANAAQCRYISFFADHNTENPLLEPNFSQDGIVPVRLGEAATAEIMAFVVTLLGHYPKLTKLAILIETATRALQAGAPEKAADLIDHHAEFLDRDAELCLIKADCHKELDEPKSELVALDLAYKADRSRWQTLVRMIWCANRCERPQVIRWALSRLERDFPERHENFVTAHNWVKYVT
nr:glycosyltransferase family 61 protein [Sulfitobacter mediterraneus]